MTGEELRAFEKATEPVFSPGEHNVYQFPTGRQPEPDVPDELLELEQALQQWC